MRNLKFVRQGVILLGLVVLRTKAQNKFCSLCTKECYTVLNRSKPFWGQFWGQIGKTNSHTHRSNKRAALVSLRIWDTRLTRHPRRKKPTNQHTSFIPVSGNPTGNSDCFFLCGSTNSCLKTVFVFTSHCSAA